MIKRLVVSHGQRERELALVGTIVVGRDPECDVSEDGDALLSRRHTEFSVGPNGVIVRDLGSRNGTFINGVKTAEGPITPGDVVQIGHLRVRLVEGDAPPQARSAHAPDAPDQGSDDELTRVVHAPRPPVAHAGSTSGPPFDDGRTVVTSPPGRGAGSPNAATSVRSAPPRPTEEEDDADDGDGTMMVRPADAALRPAIPAAAAPVSLASEPRRGSGPAVEARGDLAQPVLIQVALLAAIAFFSGASPLLFGGGAAADTAGTPAAFPLWRLAPGLVVALLATFATATLMNRRLARIGATGSADSLPGADSHLGGGTQTPAAREARR